MAAGDPIAVTNTLFTALNTDIEVTFNAADKDDADGTQKFYYTPTGKDSKVVIGVDVGGNNGAVGYSIAAGTGVFAAAAAKTGSVAALKTEAIQIETGKYLNASNRVEITFTPASGKKLKTDHVLNVWAIELL